MQDLVVLTGQVLAAKDDDVQGAQVLTMTKGFSDQSFDPVSLNSMPEIPFRENQAESGSPKGIRGRQNQEVPVGYSHLYVVENA